MEDSMSTTVKITSKGQVTIPKKIGRPLGTDVVEFEVQDDKIILKPVRSVGGSLSKYAKEYVPFNEVRDAAWEEAVTGKYK
ncbi:AbrB family transcriptional regulator [Candidatus Magnetoovum chiemensis]|nr:AbrB family transcriptional regulator [Candidatus Magnetoovum chiemensis]